MIPEIHRNIPCGVFGRLLYNYNKYITETRCIRKYAKPNKNDIVLDVGAYIGEFSIPSSVYAKKVYSIEPSPYIFRKLNINCANIQNIKCINYGIWNKNNTLSFDIQDKTADTAISKIGSDIQYDYRKLINCYRLDSLPYISDITFLKIDGEGSEPEIIESLGSHRPKTIIVDIGPERNGRDTEDMVNRMLDNMGYSVESNGVVSHAEYEQ